MSVVEIPVSEFLEGNDSRVFREVWVNTSLPENEQWYEYHAGLSDKSGRTANDWLSIKFDTTAPIMIVSNISEITDVEILVVEIQTEWDAELRYNGEVIETSSTGNASIQINLDESQELNWLYPPNSSFKGPKSGYLVQGNNTFSISVQDPAGNAFNRSFEVVLDTTKPEIISSYLSSGYFVNIYENWSWSGPTYWNSENIYENWSWSGPTLNVTDSLLHFEVTPDIQSICVDLISSSFEFVIEKCKFESSFFVTQENRGTTFTSHYSEIFNQPFFLELGNLTDGEYYFEIELIDWANNSNFYTYPLVLDRTLPEVDWDISPSNNGVLSDHRLGLSWTSSENIELEFQHNGELISEWNASYGGHFFELNFTGEHEFCIIAWDSTKGQLNENKISECQTFMLQPSLYSSAIWANWDGTVVGTEAVNLAFQRGPAQWANVTHLPADTYSADLQPTYSFEPGANFIDVDLQLEEGMNHFYLEIDELDHVHTYWLWVERDTVTPVIELYEITNRTSNLDSIRIIEGLCEPRASVTVSTEVSANSFICGTEGNFSLQLGIPSNASWHKVEVTTVDLGGNTNATSIEVLYQEWLDWAIDDAEAGGPILYYGIGVIIALISVVGLTLVLVGRKKAKIRESEDTMESGSDWINDIVEEKAPSKPDLPPGPLPEEEELRAWARGDRDVQDWQDRIPDEDILEID